MTLKIGDKVRWVQRLPRRPDRVSSVVQTVVDVIPPTEGVAGLLSTAYVKVDKSHGYWKESEFVLEGEKHEQV